MSAEYGRVELLSVQQLADLLQVSVQTVYGWRKRGVGPPGIRIGGFVRYKISDVVDWLEHRSN